MPVRTPISEKDGLYFITFTCCQWIPLIDIIDGYDIVYKWFNHLKNKGHYITGYVIMPNHIHVLIAFRNTGQSINKIISNGKRFMAYEIVNRLQESNNRSVLEQLSQAVTPSDKKRGKLHQVFKQSFDWKECKNDRFIHQKLLYIHNNPCRGAWNLVESPVNYAHSSARFYSIGEQGVYQITSYMELQDLDLTR